MKPFWFVLTTDDEQLGPLDKKELSVLVSTGRLDAFCRVRREDWAEWRWAADVFPELESSATGESGGDARLQPCPDCGQMVSLRASQCPHCGCPLEKIAAKADRPSPRRKYIAIGAAAVALAVVVGGALGIWSVLSGPKEATDDLPLPLRVQPPSVPQATLEQMTDAESFDVAIREAAAAMAEEIDDAYRRQHAVQATIRHTQSSVDLLKALAEPNPFDRKPGREDPLSTAPAESEPYQSQAESLTAECVSYLREKFPDGADAQTVRAAARTWADAKQASVEKAMEKQLQDQWGL